MSETTFQVTERLKRLSDGGDTAFRLKNRMRLATLGVLCLTLFIGVETLWTNLKALEHLFAPRSWYEPLLICVILVLALSFKQLFFKTLAKTFGDPTITIGKELVRRYRLLGITVTDTNWSFEDIQAAEICHRDDGKTYGVGPIPAPGQYFVLLRFRKTTQMLTDWIEETEAKALADAINRRIRDNREPA
ncbi:hypothetical protein [Roseibium sp. Sym1]|uniref:hypothetical protein n=1 Tax=Roseibium sp. Sym1 TaxID=3016006 RepID=UPI0022B4D4DD|nr:hypothetical protein [Roseibium sp. Sym1]